MHGFQLRFNRTYGLEIEEAVILSVEGPEFITLVTELGNLPPVAEAVELLGQIYEAVGWDDGADGRRVYTATLVLRAQTLRAA